MLKKKKTLIYPMVGLVVLGLSGSCRAQAESPSESAAPPALLGKTNPGQPVIDQDYGVPPRQRSLSVAIFAGGCFWCVESAFDGLKGVKATISGFVGGKEKRPTYKQVSSGRTGHAEALYVVYDPKEVSYQKLLETYWHNIDPTDKGGQFCDRGTQYRPEIFFRTQAQKQQAEKSRAQLAKTKPFKGPIVVDITPAGPFTAAEEYHQNFYLKNPAHYRRYRLGCGRDRRLQELWGAAAGGH